MGSTIALNPGAQPKSADQYAYNSQQRYGGDSAPNFLKLYPGGSDDQAKDSAFFAGRDEMAWVMRNWVRMDSKTGKSKGYVYFFTHQPYVAPGCVSEAAGLLPMRMGHDGILSWRCSMCSIILATRLGRTWISRFRTPCLLIG